jgi:serine/threonine protein kinase
MATTSCLSDEVLLALATGEPGDEAVREHVRHCTDCAAELARLRDEVQALRAAACEPDPEASAPSTDATASYTPASTPDGSTIDVTTVPPPAGAFTAPHVDEIPAPYEHLEKLGEGGMGVVYLVRDPDMDRQLALKVLREKYRHDARVARKFLEEARITAQLQYPGIPPVHSQGTLADGRPYLTMKRIRGETLAVLLKRRDDPSQDQACFLAIFEQLCQTLAYAHSRGVVHRDLKPANVMVGAFGEVQVMDWGLCKHLGGPAEMDEEGDLRPLPEGMDRDESHGVMGTLAFMPPEQARGEVVRIDARSDVFGLGAILCVVLAGKPPYTARTTPALLIQAGRADLADAYARIDRCGADADLIALARDCLAPGRDDRPRDAGAVAGRVSAHLAVVQEKLQAAERERAVAEARAEEEAKRRLVADDLAREAQARAAEERKRRRATIGLAAALGSAAAALVAVVILSLLYADRMSKLTAAKAEKARTEAEAAQR